MKRTLTIIEAAEYLGVSTRTVRTRIADGRLQAERATTPHPHWRVLSESLTKRSPERLAKA
jgi:excisionase family DNA binding protein